MMRAKMRVTFVKDGEDCTQLSLSAVGPKGAYPADGSDEDNTFAKWTPCATLTMSITNPELLGKFKLEDVFYVDFMPVPDAPKP